MFDLPEQFSEFGEARQKGFLAVKDVKEQGGRVAGVFCTFTPYEILDAAGFLPVITPVVEFSQSARSS